MNNKIKLFLLLIFGFSLMFAGVSFGAYTDNDKPCFTPQGNLAGSIAVNELCKIGPSASISFQRACSIRGQGGGGAELNWIKVPYGPDGRNTEVIKSVLQSNNAIDWSNFGNLRSDYGCSRFYNTRVRDNMIYTIPFMTECDGAVGANPCATNCLMGAQIYINAKTAMVRSCLPGYVSATQWGNIGCWLPGWGGGDVGPRNTFLTAGNFSDGPLSGCGPLVESISMSTNLRPTSGMSGDQAYRNGRIEVARAENPSRNFTLNWSLSNPGATCKLSGVNASIPVNSDGTPNEFTAEINNETLSGDVGVNGMSGAVSTYRNSRTFYGAVDGIYSYTMKCSGVLNGQESPTRGPVTSDPIKIFVGDIPSGPTIEQFSIVTENNEDLVSKTADDGTSYYQIPINKSFKLKWDTANVGDTSATIGTVNAAPTKPIKILRRKIGVSSLSPEYSRVMVSTEKTNAISDPEMIDFSGTDKTGTYIFWIEAAGPFGLTTSSYPDPLAPCSANQCIKVQALNAGRPDIPTGEFTADKTQIAQGESVILTWNIVGASSISINHDIGIVQDAGSVTVKPTTATTYTLTAKSPIPTTPDTTKSVTITIRTSGIAPQEITDFVPPEEIKMTPQEGAPTEQKTDLKVNAVDGPVTLNAPATFSLSWNLDHYCLATGSWLSVKTKAGAESVTLNKNGKYTYSLYCPGYGSDSVEINIVNGLNDGLLGSNGLLGGLGMGGAATSMPYAEASASTDLINYSQSIKVIRGEPTDIYIKVDQDINRDGKTTRDASGSWSELLSFGGYCLYNDSLVQGTPKFEGMVKDPENPEACNAKLGTFTFNDEPGTYKYGVFKLLQNDDKFSNISYINIIVENIPSPETAPVIDLKINGNDAPEQILGTPANFDLFWNVINATSCEASGSWSGSKELSGLQNFVSSSKKDFIYTLTCVGQLGTMAKTITLRVAEAPTCSFTALPPSINRLSSFVTDSELSWKCDYADECSLSPNAANAKIKTYGSLRVSPTQTTNYILTCNNSDVFKSFEAKVEVIN